MRTLLVAVLALLATAEPRSAGLQLTIDGTMFRVNGDVKFLVFVSYFDALDSTAANLRSDFTTLKRRGVDGVRIMPNWWGKTATESPNFYAAQTVISPAGSAINLAKLRNVLDIARDAGLVVDLSFTAETLRACPKPPCAAAARPSSPLTARQLSAALVAITRDLAGSQYRHVLFDIQNESNLWPAADRALDAPTVAGIVAAIHDVDPLRAVTASRDQTVNPTETAGFAEAARLDVVTWHEERMPSWWTHTAAWVGQMRAKSGKPIYLQEPEPWRNNSAWTLAGITANVRAAKDSGAAAWCFHTHAGYYLDDGSSWFKHLAPDEARFVDELLRALRAS